MPTRIITKEEALLVLKEIVSERPDYVYPKVELGSCFYRYEGAPSCLLGHLFDRLGVIDLFLKPDDGVGEDCGDGHAGPIAAYSNWACGAVKIEGDLLPILARAQSEQDVGTPWGDALNIALTIFA